MAMNELYKMFAFGSELKDVRRDHLKKHSLTNILTISLCAMIVPSPAVIALLLRI